MSLRALQPRKYPCRLVTIAEHMQGKVFVCKTLARLHMRCRNQERQTLRLLANMNDDLSWALRTVRGEMKEVAT